MYVHTVIGCMGLRQMWRVLSFYFNKSIKASRVIYSALAHVGCFNRMLSLMRKTEYTEEWTMEQRRTLRKTICKCLIL